MCCKYHLDQKLFSDYGIDRLSVNCAKTNYHLVPAYLSYSCCGTGATLSTVHVQTLGHKGVDSLSKVNANQPFIPRPSHTGSRLQRCSDKDNRLDLDTAEGHGSGSDNITGPPTA